MLQIVTVGCVWEVGNEITIYSLQFMNTDNHYQSCGYGIIFIFRVQRGSPSGGLQHEISYSTWSKKEKQENLRSCTRASWSDYHHLASTLHLCWFLIPLQIVITISFLTTKCYFCTYTLITCYSISFITAGSSIVFDMHDALFILAFIFLQFESNRKLV